MMFLLIISRLYKLRLKAVKFYNFGALLQKLFRYRYNRTDINYPYCTRNEFTASLLVNSMNGIKGVNTVWDFIENDPEHVCE